MALIPIVKPCLLEYGVRSFMIIKIAHREGHKPNDYGHSRGKRFKGIPDIVKTKLNIGNQS
jgi:hypothetical protein